MTGRKGRAARAVDRPSSTGQTPEARAAADDGRTVAHTSPRRGRRSPVDSNGCPTDCALGVAKSPAQDYNEVSMRSMLPLRQHGPRLLASGFLGALLLASFSVGASAGVPQGAGCPAR